MSHRLGIMVPPDLPPREFVDFVTAVERHGFDELWVPEDCFYNGGVAQVATALSATTRLHVGVGILPAAVRNVAYAALDIAFLANLHPGRLTVGIGHGMRPWLEQVGAWPASSLTLLREYLDALRALLAGRSVTADGRYVKLDRVRLVHPPDVPPAVLAGVRGPKSLALAGRHADGCLLAEPVAPEYLAVALRDIDPPAGFEIATYNLATVDADPAVAVARIRPHLGLVADPAWAVQIAPLPFAAELRRLHQKDPERFTDNLPDEWITQLAITGDLASACSRIERLRAAGADRVIMTPVGSDPAATLDQLAALVPPPDQPARDRSARDRPTQDQPTQPSSGDPA